VDVQRTVDRLAELGVNTYLYQVWHGKQDWDDFPAFADAAAKKHIDVWVYLVPWSETTLKKKKLELLRARSRWTTSRGRCDREGVGGASEPGRVDDRRFLRQHAPAGPVYAAVREADGGGGAANNAKLKFYPVVYFQQPWADFIERFGPLMDGVIACYPRSEEEIDNARTYLNDGPHGPSLVVRIPRHAKLAAGASAVASATFTVNDASRAKLQFFWDDQNNSAERGQHEAFARVDGEIVWRQDIANEAVDRWINVNLAERVGDETGACRSKSA
jgi:hypothetical protein